MIKKYTLDIGEVVKRSGLPASTLRFYEEKGLIVPVGRKGLRRIFDVAILDQLSLILLGRNAGFSLDEIADMFTAEGPKIDKEQLQAKADQLDKSIQHLMAMRDGLRHAASCPAPSHFECPTFQKLVRVARKDQVRRGNKHSR